jgi:hypothetical protein
MGVMLGGAEPGPRERIFPGRLCLKSDGLRLHGKAQRYRKTLAGYALWIFQYPVNLGMDLSETLPMFLTLTLCSTV